MFDNFCFIARRVSFLTSSSASRFLDGRPDSPRWPPSTRWVETGRPGRRSTPCALLTMSNESSTGQGGDREGTGRGSIHPSGFEFKAIDHLNPSTDPSEGPKDRSASDNCCVPRSLWKRVCDSGSANGRILIASTTLDLESKRQVS